MYDVNVFPAHAGVIPSPARYGVTGGGFPRTRGGDPLNDETFNAASGFSPHTRG